MKKLLILFSFIALYIACAPSEENSSSDNDSYDRTALLTNWADNIIIPSYTNYQAKLQLLSTDATAFTTAPTTANLTKVRASWLEAYKAYQYVAAYSFDKAQEVYFREKANTFPTDATGTKSNIDSNTYNLSLISQFSKQGFPALDYILNGLGTDDASIVTFYTTNAKAANYKKYLTDLVATLKATNDTVLADWNSSYRATYIANNGKTVTSSVSKTINAFLENLEKNTRAGKVGIPAGLFSGGTKFPEKVEAFYHNNVSKTLYNTAIQATQDFFNGKNFNSTVTGPSLKGYLDFLDIKTKIGNQNLSTVINTQFETVFTKNKELRESFATQVTTDNNKMTDSHDALQQIVIYLKLDMMQSLKITVDYVDNDGD